MMAGVMSLDVFLATVRDGDERGWEAELDFLVHSHGEQLAALVLDVAANGIREPIHIGSDGRCWDGHHRVAAAVLLGLSRIPVRDDRDPPYDPTHGQIDRDIQERVDAMNPSSLAQRVAIERTLQERRDRGGVVLGVDPTAAVSDAN